MKKSLLMIFILESPCLISSLPENCDEVASNEKYFQCRNKYKEGSPCTIITNIIESCSGELSQCRSKDEINDINADLIKVNMGGGNTSLDGCEIVDRYRKDGLLGNKTAKNCSQQDENQMKSTFQNCSLLVANQLSVVKNTLPVTTYSQVMCDTLKNISNTCKVHLETCETVSVKKEDLFKTEMETAKKSIQDMLNITENVPTLESCNITTPPSLLDSISDIFDGATNVYESTKNIVKALSSESENNEQMITVASSGCRFGLDPSFGLVLGVLSVLLQ